MGAFIYNIYIYIIIYIYLYWLIPSHISEWLNQIKKSFWCVNPYGSLMDLYLMRQDSLEDHDPLNCFGLRRLFQWRSRVKLRRSPGFIVCGSSLPRRARALSKLPRVFSGTRWEKRTEKRFFRRLLFRVTYSESWWINVGQPPELSTRHHLVYIYIII